MDVVQNYLALLHTLLPSSLINPLISAISTVYGLTKSLQTHFAPLITQVITQPDIASVLMLLAILWFSLQIFGMLYRSVMFWVRLVWQLAQYSFLIVVSLWIWNRGVDGALRDAQELAGFWMGEYQKFSGEAKAWKVAEEAQIRMQAKQRAAGGGGFGWR
ncbi:hypothetical protein DPSP01_012739 [Paraphaeosphaeria sporulosa]|uniref:Uncharacterized protein n=1 Tax=Paraphaeosphaeria sporulosa TaxID=1460663 RepID=A0A177D0A4_9PLEO|nr:uncharacterized protein CC84DRAFT_1212127 [Paraphaeosphaeria sporulosa]OAG12602.1 hypothetical protein CC84DRAFT_1212127 [Paraphaeosphaeria sporulosa]